MGTAEGENRRAAWGIEAEGKVGSAPCVRRLAPMFGAVSADRQSAGSGALAGVSTRRAAWGIDAEGKTISFSDFQNPIHLRNQSFSSLFSMFRSRSGGRGAESKDTRFRIVLVTQNPTKTKL